MDKQVTWLSWIQVFVSPSNNLNTGTDSYLICILKMELLTTIKIKQYSSTLLPTSFPVAYYLGHLTDVRTVMGSNLSSLSERKLKAKYNCMRRMPPCLTPRRKTDTPVTFSWDIPSPYPYKGPLPLTSEQCRIQSSP